MNLTTQQKIKIASHLLSLANKRIRPIEHYGICGNLLRFYKGGPSATYLVCDIAASWPKCSGSYFYPVPHPAGPFDAIRIYDLWGEDQYGNDRRELCEFIACTIIDSL